jgi:hypothetical protein
MSAACLYVKRDDGLSKYVWRQKDKHNLNEA